jgi:integrase/recombinase XerC
VETVESGGGDAGGVPTAPGDAMLHAALSPAGHALPIGLSAIAAAVVLDAHQLLDRYRTHLLRDRHREPRTWKTYRDTITSFWAFAGKSPQRCTTQDLHRFLYDRTLADATRASYTSHIKAAYRWWHAVKLLPTDPFANYATPTVRPGPPRSLSLGDVARLIGFAYNQPRLHLIVWLAYGAGLRVGEIARLRIEDCAVFGVRPHLRVYGKGRRERLVWLHPDVAEVLRGALVGRPQSGPVVESEVDGGRPISPARVSRLVSWALRDVGIAATGHQLRHTFATELLAAGKGQNLHAISRLLGHASVATTERYVSGYDQDAYDAVQGLPDPRPGPRRLPAG